MNGDIKKAKLPDSIIMEEERNRYRQTWMSVLGKAQTAYDKLCEDKDIGEKLPDFDNLNSDWICNWIEEKVTAVMSDPNYTFNVRTQAAQEWRNLGNELLPLVRQIEAVHHLDPEAKIEMAGCHIVISNMDQLLDAKTTYKVPTKYKHLYNLIGTAKEAVDQLVSYTKKNGLFELADPMALLRFANTGESFARVCFSDEENKKIREEEKSYMHEQAIIKAKHEHELRRHNEERQAKLDEVAAERRRRGEEVPIHRVTVKEQSNTNASGFETKEL